MKSKSNEFAGTVNYTRRIRSNAMKLSDVWLLSKKIAVGVVITVVPLAILAGGLWMTQRHTSGQTRPAQASSSQVDHAN